MRCLVCVAQAVLCLFIFFSPLWGMAEPIGPVDQEALEILKKMNNELLSQQVVSFRAIENEEEVLDNGQKIMYSKEIHFEMMRPNKFHVRHHSVENKLEMFYDSASFTLFNKELNFFTTFAAPPTTSEVFVELSNKRNIEVVARDLLRDDSYDFLSTSINSGFVVGDAFVDGVLCTHLAFRLVDTDMQIWITQGEQPLPKKYVVTSRWMSAAPQYEVNFFDWAFQDTVDGSVFVFKAPQEAHEIPFVETISAQEAN